MKYAFSVFGWAADIAGCGYYRIGLPLWALRTGMNIRAEASVIIPEEAKEEADVIVGQRVCIETATKIWKTLHDKGKHLVFEVDDDLWNVHPHNELAFEFFNKTDVQERLIANIKIADLVTVTNEALAEVVSKYNPNIAILPNYIDEAMLRFERPRRDKLTVGWSGSFTHQSDFSPMGPQLGRFLKKNPEVGMHFIGTNYSKTIKRESRFTEWSQEVATYHEAIDFDIGVIPLAPGVFNRSKSHIKALEYAALGIPVVASDYGPYRDFVVHGVTGFLVKHDHEWGHYLYALVKDEGLRESMGAKARELAAEHTIQRNVHRWYAAYASLLPPTPLVMAGEGVGTDGALCI